MLGLLRLLLVLAAFFVVRRLIVGIVSPRRRNSGPGRPNVRDGRSRSGRKTEDLSHGQPIEEAEYEELD